VQKIKRGTAPEAIGLVENPDVAIASARSRRAGAVVMGFALETEEVRDRAREKLERKGFDIVVANDPGEPGAGFEVTTNRVMVLDREGREEDLPLLDKEALAAVLLDRIAERLRAAPQEA
jgi:phosphopantothenoylcysteine decarboxylase/phosphopantothenate--cysteine ligase